jgi:phosphoribosylcarboxyaminoimidazole (NCAIR) mutase
MRRAAAVLEKLELPHFGRIVSAHRVPDPPSTSAARPSPEASTGSSREPARRGPLPGAIVALGPLPHVPEETGKRERRS